MTEVLAVLLLSFSGLDGHRININPIDVVLIREPQIYEHGASCVIFTADGDFIPVQETCRQVHKKIDGGRP